MFDFEFLNILKINFMLPQEKIKYTSFQKESTIKVQLIYASCRYFSIFLSLYHKFIKIRQNDPSGSTVCTDFICVVC